MKNQAIQYLALDVHQATTVATLRDKNGAICMRATVATEAKAIVGLVRAAGKRVHVVSEEGTQAQWLHDLLRPHAEHVLVCNIRGRRSETTNKSDRIDADWLSEQFRLGGLRPVHHGTPSVATLKELVRCYTSLVEDSTRVMQRVKAIYRGRAIGTAGKAVYRPSQRRMWLAKLERPGARARASSLLEQLDKLGAEVEGAKSNDRRSTATVGVEGSAVDSIPWADSSGAAAGHHCDTAPVPHEAEVVAVRERVDQRPR